MRDRPGGAGHRAGRELGVAIAVEDWHPYGSRLTCHATASTCIRRRRTHVS